MDADPGSSTVGISKIEDAYNSVEDLTEREAQSSRAMQSGSTEPLLPSTSLGSFPADVAAEDSGSLREPLLRHMGSEGGVLGGAEGSEPAVETSGKDEEEGLVLFECRVCKEELMGWRLAPGEVASSAGRAAAAAAVATELMSRTRGGGGVSAGRVGREVVKGGERMVRPCECVGSMERVHLKCLQQWIERRRMDGADSERAMRCEVCHAPYRLRVHESKCPDRDVNANAGTCTV